MSEEEKDGKNYEGKVGEHAWVRLYDKEIWQVPIKKEKEKRKKKKKKKEILQVNNNDLETNILLGKKIEAKQCFESIKNAIILFFNK